MSNLAKKVEVAANVGIVVVAIMLVGIFARQYLLPGQGQNQAGTASARRMPRSGDTVALDGVDWRGNGKTLLLAVSTTCRFCTQSSPFYQRLVREHGDAQLIALLPQTVGEGQAYLKNLGVEINEVRQITLDNLGVSGTPTLILVDSSGKVTGAWMGALTPAQENEVITRLRA